MVRVRISSGSHTTTQYTSITTQQQQQSLLYTIHTPSISRGSPIRCLSAAAQCCIPSFCGLSESDDEVQQMFGTLKSGTRNTRPI